MGRTLFVWLMQSLHSDVKQTFTICVQVDMGNSSLTEIPEDTPTNITRWILSNNSLVMSASDINTLQKYRRITVLDLSYNLIQMLPPRAFDKLTNLEILKLRGNSLQTLDINIFKGLTKLRSLDLKDNPWNCSCSLTSLIKELNDSGVLIGENECLSCFLFSDTVYKPFMCFSSGLMARDGETHTGSHSWKFLLGVVALTLSTSMLIVCAVKSPSWYKLLFNYRHQRLREDVEHNQTDTSAQELDTGLSLQPFEDDDGFIEDGYIEPGNYREHADADES
uniref:Leucine rich repeat containing 19 n=1 Tax=Sinocyclocheilus anshuiensis TaxID=1608454 RepID=A0A671MCR9_9TELE